MKVQKLLMDVGAIEIAFSDHVYDSILTMVTQHKETQLNHSYRLNIFLQKLLELVYFMCMNVLATCMAVYHVPSSTVGQQRSLDP